MNEEEIKIEEVKDEIKDVNWKAIYSLKFKQLYPDLITFFKSGDYPQKSKSAQSRFKKHLELFKYDKENKQIYLLANNLPDKNLEGIVQTPIKLIVINPNRNIKKTKRR